MSQHGAGINRKIRAHRQKWYYLPDLERDQLRQRYKNDKNAYFATFRLDEGDQDKMLERGMAAFIKLEARLLRTAQFHHYEQRAELACSDLIRRITLNSAIPDLVFVAIDFEGDACRKGVSELGLAKLDMRHLEGGIKGANIAVASRKRRNFLFHEYTRIDMAQLPAAISNSLSDKQVILIGHCISQELRTMEHLGVPISNLPNVIGSE